MLRVVSSEEPCISLSLLCDLSLQRNFFFASRKAAQPAQTPAPLKSCAGEGALLNQYSMRVVYVSVI